jgi:hypothetical protein
VNARFTERFAHEKSRPKAAFKFLIFGLVVTSL